MGITRVVIDGRIEKVDTFDTGPPLLHSRYEWSTRYRKNLFLEVLTYAIVLLVVLSIVGIVLYMVIQDVALIVFIVGLTTFSFLIAEFWKKGIFGHRVPPGLYQEGFMHPRGFLIPYIELRGLEIKGSLIPLFHEKVVLQPYHENRLVDYTEWEVDKPVLGDDGIQVLKERISAVDGMEEG
ncbi:MAG: hypothetical protein GQ558_05275 [Thermoplasmata archaeon]|nr:hypothetical protein [Thermoplasmata archaeon]